MARVSVISGNVPILADVEGPLGGPTVLLLHAGGESRTVWLPITEAVVAHGWRTISPDLRGHGESGRAAAYHLDDFVLDLERVIEELGDEPLVVVGGSIGGALGLILAGERRLSVAGLVLLDVATRPSADSALRERRKIVEAQSRGVEALRAVDGEFMRGSFLDDVVATFDRWSRAARQLRIPTLLILGTRSTVVGSSELQATKDDIPQIEVVAVPAGHLVARDCPSEVAAHLTRFLDRVGPEPPLVRA